MTSRKRSKLSRTNPAQAVILTAGQLEWNAVCSHLTNPQEVRHAEGTVYQTGLFSAAEGNWEVAVVETGTGNTIAGVETERAIAFFQPEVILCVGLAGGLKDVAIGDVVVSSKIYGIDGGKDHKDFLELRPHVSNASYRLEQRARADSRSKNWLIRINSEKAPSPEPRVHLGPFAASEKIVASKRAETAKLIREKYGDALAVEMEGRGVLEAVRANHSEAIVIRGISNLLDDKNAAEKDGSKILAASHAAAFAFELLAKLTHSSSGRKPSSPASQKSVRERPRKQSSAALSQTVKSALRQ